MFVVGLICLLKPRQSWPAKMDLTPQRRAFSRALNRLARNTKIVFSPQRGGFSWALCLYDYFTDSICLRDGRSTWEPRTAI